MATSNSTTNNSINLVVQAPNGQQIIKIVRNNNSQPLTKEGVKAIVKEVTHQQNLLNNHTIVRNVGFKQQQQQQQSQPSAQHQPQHQQHIFQQPAAHYQPIQYNTAPPSSSSSSSSSSSMVNNKTTSIKLTAQQLAAIKANNIQSSTKLPQTTSSFTLQNYGKTIIGTSSTSKPSMVIAGGSGINNNNDNKNNNNNNNTSNVQPIIVKPSGSTGKKSQLTTPIVRRRKTDRLGKGLRHFSMKVCEKVKEKGKTTYNEVADELVTEEVEVHPIDPANYDQKNIRRRVYDALNVLMAMNIISKDKKEIRWIGLPTNSAQQCTSLELENKKRKESIAAKQQQLRDLILQLVSFKSLVTRNKEAEDRGIIPSQSSAIQLPFIIVNTHKKTHINCSISNDKSEYFFKFDNKFEIHDDIDVLKRMGLLLGLDKGECTYEDIERAKTMVPKTFEKYIECYGRGQEENTDDYDMDLNVHSHETKIEPSSDVDEDADDDDDDGDGDGDHFSDEASEFD